MYQIKRIQANEKVLQEFSRHELRQYAKHLGLKIGQNKKDTITNIVNSNKGHLIVALLWKNHEDYLN